MITSIDHVGCLVPDMDEAIADYMLLYPDGVVSERYNIVPQRVYVQFFSIGNMRIEFVQPTDDQSSLYRELKKHPGYYHVGVYTDDMDGEIDRLVKLGYRKLTKYISAAYNNRYCAFLYNLEMHLIELIEME